MVVADMYGFGLQRAGYYVAAFPDPTSFLKSLDVGLPDLVVLDWNLPVMNGGEVLETLRRDGRTQNVPVLVRSNLTGTDGGELASARRHGVVAWLVKSKTTPDKLARKLSETIPPTATAS